MIVLWEFRILAAVTVIFVGGLSALSSVADFKAPAPKLTTDTAAVPGADQLLAAGSAADIAPFRTDLKTNYATALADQALAASGADMKQTGQAAQKAVKDALHIGPHDSRMWLLLAILQARTNPGDAIVTECLKMSYLTSPNRIALMPLRLASVTSSNALNDPDLKELAGSDVRAMLTNGPNQRQLLTNDYLRASAIGKTFLEESSRTIDPSFANTLRSAH
jgi:hypothetical protein